MRPVTVAVVAGLMLVAVTGCTNGDDGSTPTSVLPARSVDAGEVEVTVTPVRVDGNGATFLVALDTHTVELDVDLVATATLRIGDTVWPTESWDGSGPGGHHRSGQLHFRAGGPANGAAQLLIAGLPEPVEISWELPSG